MFGKNSSTTLSFIALTLISLFAGCTRFGHDGKLSESKPNRALTKLTSSLLFYDNFPGSSLSSSWNVTSGSFSVSGNTVSPQVAGSEALVNGISATNMWVSAAVDGTQLPAGGACARIIARSQDANDGYLASLCKSSVGYNIVASKMVGGSIKDLYTAAKTVGTGNLSLYVYLGNLAVYYNGVQVISVYDSTFSLAGGFGFRGAPGAIFQSFAVYSQPPSPTLPYAENFSGSSLSQDWIISSGAFSVASNTASSLVVHSQAVLDVPAFSDGYVSAALDATLLGPSSGCPRVLARFKDYANNYQAMLCKNSDGTYAVNLSKDVNGSLTNLTGNISIGAGQGNVGLGFSGSNLQLYFNGMAITPIVVDSSLTSGTVGIQGPPGANFQSFTASSAPLGIASLPYSDTFSGSTFSPNWSVSRGDFSISNNIVSPSLTGSQAVLNGISLSGGFVSAAIDVTALPTSGGCARVVAGFQDANNNYLGSLCKNSDGTYSGNITRVLAGNQSVLVSTTVGAGQGNLGLSINSGSLQLYYNGLPVGAAVSDSSFSSGQVGIQGPVGSSYTSFLASNQVPLSPSLPYSDNFSGNALSGNWSVPRGAFSISGNSATSLLGGSQAVLNVSSFLNGIVSAQVDATKLTGTLCAKLLLRYVNASNNYAGQLCRNSDGSYSTSIALIKNGTQTNLTSPTASSGAGALLFGYYNGNLQLYLNGALLASTYDSSLGAGSVGIQGGPGANFKNFSATATIPPPAVSLVYPTNGLILPSGAVTLQANASSIAGISYVSYLVDGVVVGSSAAAPTYNYSYDTSALNPTKTHTFVAEATDGVPAPGTQFAYSAPPATVTVKDGTPPSVSLNMLPADVVSGTSLNLSVTASDKYYPVTSVAYFLTGTTLGSSLVSPSFPFSYSHTLSDGFNGNESVYAVATDSAGISGTSAKQTICFEQPPVVNSIVAVDSTTGKSSIPITDQIKLSLTASATFPCAQAQTVNYYADSTSNLLTPGGVSLLAGGPNFLVNIPANKLSPGSHLIFAIAQDNFGVNSTLSSPLPPDSASVTITIPPPNVGPLTVVDNNGIILTPLSSINPGISTSITVSGTATSTGGQIIEVDLYVDVVSPATKVATQLGGGTSSLKFSLPYKFAVNPNIEDGKLHSFIVVAMDSSSPPQSSSPQADSFTILDITPPTISGFNPSDGSTVGTASSIVNVSFQVTPGHPTVSVKTVNCIVDSSFTIPASSLGGGSYSCTWDTQGKVTPPIERLHAFQVQATESDGAPVGTATVHYRVVDLTPPVLAVNTLSLQYPFILNGPFVLTTTVQPDQGIVLVKFFRDTSVSLGFSATPDTSGNFSAVIAVPDFLDGNEHVLYAIAYDGDGFGRTSITTSFATLNLQSPIVNFATPSGSSFPNSGPANFAVAVTDPLPISYVTFSIDSFGDLATVTTPQTTGAYIGDYVASIDLSNIGGSPLSAGLHTLYVMATPVSGPPSASMPLTFFVTDRTPPTLSSMTATSTGTSVDVQVTAADSDGDGIKSVEFRYSRGMSVSGTYTALPDLTGCGSSTCTLSEMTSITSPDYYTFFAEAQDGFGNSGLSSGYTIFVANSSAPTSTATSTSFTIDLTTGLAFMKVSPTNHTAIFTGTVQFSYPDSVTAVNLIIDAVAQPLASCTLTSLTSTSDGVSCTADLTNYADGSFHSFHLNAIDTATLPNSSNLFVAQLIDQEPPQVQWLSPSPSTILGTITLVASASDPSHIQSVQFCIDGCSTGIIAGTTATPDASGHYSIAYDTSKLSHGLHQFTATATDNAGNANSTPNITLNY